MFVTRVIQTPFFVGRRELLQLYVPLISSATDAPTGGAVYACFINPITQLIRTLGLGDVACTGSETILAKNLS